MGTGEKGMKEIQGLIHRAEEKDHNATVNAITTYSLIGDYDRLVKRLKKIVEGH